MKFLLDTVVAPDNRAVEFSKQQQTMTSSSSSHDIMSPISEGWQHTISESQKNFLTLLKFLFIYT